MASSPCFSSSQICVSFKVNHSRLPSRIASHEKVGRSCRFAPRGMDSELFHQQAIRKEVRQWIGWSSLGGSKTIKRSNLGRMTNPGRKSFAVNAAWLLSPEVVADNAFTLATVAVLPFYTFMVAAPQAEITKKLMASSIPYMVLGTLYTYLLYLSWTPEKMQLLFASKYLLPELPGIAKMFSSEITLATAWIHLVAVDLFAARQVYHDGLLNKVETRHSVTLCLLFCPTGILVHFITKMLTEKHRNTVTKKQSFH